MDNVYFLPRFLGRRPWTRNLAKGIEARILGAYALYLRRLPLARAQTSARGTFTRIGMRTRAHRELLANLAVLHPAATADQLESKAQRTWGWLGVTFAEFVHIGELAATVAERVSFEIAPEVEAVLRAPGQAAVLASAHVGPWMLCNLVAGRHGFPLTTTLPSSSNEGIDQLLRRMLRDLPVEQVTMDEGLEPLSAEIKRGHRVFVAVDGWNDEGHTVGMFGERMRLDPTAALLAVRHDCPLVPIHALRLPGGRYRVVARRALRPDKAIGSESERAKRLTEAFAHDFERWIREVPGQWLCLTPRWADETVWGALTRAVERTQLPAEQAGRVSDEQLDETLSGQVSTPGSQPSRGAA
ncbi:MAG TPA: lysophospholipid acyltransferase family protein [Pseudomonadales bacterium]|nr:lysophospholipid acyltransferase family protein [Pseudomonadales bacterium]